MDKEEIILKRLKELADLIKKHNYNYHTLDKPNITDQEFDNLVKENDVPCAALAFEDLKQMFQKESFFL